MSYKFYRSVAPVLLAATFVSACGTISDALPDRRVDYKKGRVSAQPLELPPDVTTSSINPELRVPGSDLDGTARYSEYAGTANPVAGQVVTATSVLPSIDAVRLEKSGGERWLLVKGDRRKVWDKVREFWAESGFRLLESSPNAGLMVTSWKENRADLADDPITKTLSSVADFLYTTGTRDQYRVRMERGENPADTEIHMVHQGMVETAQEISQTSGIEGTVWSPRPAEPALAAEMLARMQAFLLKSEVNKQRAIAQGDLPSGPIALMIEDENGGLQMRLSVDFSKAWRLTGRALDRAGYVIGERDRTRGLYFVRYNPPDQVAETPEKKGLLSRMAFWRSDEPKAPKPVYPQMVVSLEESSESTWLLIKDKDSLEPLRSRDADRLLADLEREFN